MRLRLCILFLVGLQAFCSAKKTHTASFYFATLPSNHIADYSWSINGKVIDPKTKCTLPIHYPGLDTILLVHGAQKCIILTRFEKQHLYELTPEDQENDFRIKDMTVFVNKKNSGTHRSKSKPDTIKIIFNYQKPLTDTLIAGIIVNSANGKTFNSGNTVILEETVQNHTPNTCLDIRIGTGTVRREIDTYNEYRYLKFFYNYAKDTSFVFDRELISFEYNFFNPSTLIIDYDHTLKKVKLRLK